MDVGIPITIKDGRVCFQPATTARMIIFNRLILIPSLRVLHPSFVEVCTEIGNDSVIIKGYYTAKRKYYIEIHDLVNKTQKQLRQLDSIEDAEPWIEQYVPKNLVDYVIKILSYRGVY